MDSGWQAQQALPQRDVLLTDLTLFYHVSLYARVHLFTQVSRWTGYVEPSDSVGSDYAFTGSQLESLFNSPPLF